MKKNLLFLVNPKAGRAEIKNKVLDIIDLFVKANYQVTIHTTQKPMDIPEIIKKEGERYDLLVCCGGDGTLNETVNGLIESGYPLPLGYIPAGTVNDFASSLEIPRNMLEAAETIINGEPFLCDVGSFNQRYFSYIAAFGAFTEVSYQTPQVSKNLFGRAAYILEGIKRLPSMKTYHIKMEHNGETIEGDFILGLFSNSSSVGGFKVNSDEKISMCDGLLEAILVQPAKSVAEHQAILNTLLWQQIDTHYFLNFKTSSVKITSDENISWTLDGEDGGNPKEILIENKPNAITIMTTGNKSLECMQQTTTLPFKMHI